MTSQSITDLKTRFESMAPKDRIALTILAIFLLALVIVYLLLLPAHRFANEAAEHHQQKAQLLAWMQANETAARALSKQPGNRAKAPTGQSILSLASQQAQTNAISFKRFEPFGEGGLRIWLDTVPFNNMLQWLTQLQQRYGVEIQQISIDRGKANGSVNAKLELFLAG